jgi:hypothetical protein
MPRDRASPVLRVSALRVTIVAALATVPELEKLAAVLAPVKATRFAGGLTAGLDRRSARLPCHATGRDGRMVIAVEQKD